MVTRPGGLGRRTESADHATAAPRLLFLPARDQWRVSYSGGCYEPDTDDDIQRLLGLLPLDVLEDPSAWPADHHDGTVIATRTTSSPVLEFYSGSDEDPPDRVHPTVEQIATPDVRWTEPPAADGWIETDARLHVDAARQIGIEAYLPPSDGAGPKELAIVTHVGRRIVVDVVVLDRGEASWVEVYTADRVAHGLIIDLHSSYSEAVAQDPRSLGFVLSDIFVR